MVFQYGIKKNMAMANFCAPKYEYKPHEFDAGYLA
jgi:hypothetical protein